MSPSDPAWPVRLIDYAMIHQARYLAQGDVALLSEAIRDDGEAAGMPPTTHAARSRCLEGLATVYLIRFEHSKDTKDLDECITHLEEMLQASMGHNIIHTLTMLATCEMYSFDYQTKSIDTLFKGLDYLARVMEAPDALPHERHYAARLRIEIHIRIGNPRPVSKLVQEWARLVPQSLPQYLDASDKQTSLAVLSDYASQMTALLICLQENPFTVLTVYESTRGIIISSLGDIRTSVSDLKRLNPYLADNSVDCRKALDKGEFLEASESLGVWYRQDRRHEANKKLQESINSIRRVPGFERFLLSPTEDQIKAAASLAPIVLLNDSEISCDALVIQTTGLSIVRLPDLRIENVDRF